MKPDWIKALLALALVGLSLLSIRSCFADEWFSGARLYLDVTPDRYVEFCQAEGDYASHLGAEVDIWQHGRHRFRTIWIHNSCVEEDSLTEQSRNVIGFGYVIELW